LADHPLQMTQLVDPARIALKPALRTGLFSIEIFSSTFWTLHATIISYYAYQSK
jgi:hypothetical protein